MAELDKVEFEFPDEIEAKEAAKAEKAEVKEEDDSSEIEIIEFDSQSSALSQSWIFLQSFYRTLHDVFQLIKSKLTCLWISSDILFEIIN